jgi:hypothetical protein
LQVRILPGQRRRSASGQRGEAVLSMTQKGINGA